MVDLEIREQLPDDALVFDIQSYDNSIIGVTLDGRVIYDLQLMVNEYMLENDCSELDALEWIEYNTIRSLPYADGKAPIIVSSEI